MSADQPSTEPAEPSPADPLSTEATAARIGPNRASDHGSMPQLYIACPLTGLDSDPKRLEETSHRIATVRRTIEDATLDHRIETEQWPVSLHIPFEKTRPGSDGGLNPSTVYDRNLDALLASDGLIVVTDQHCSAGIGQEIEWATRAGIPVLYLARVPASRQILGNPHNVECRTCADATMMADHVRVWLGKHRSQIQNGPNRRENRRLVYLDLAVRLRAAWESSTQRTPLAAQMNLPFAAVDSIVKTPERVAVTPWWTICGLAVLLGVDLEARHGLNFAQSRAWVKAAEDGGWDRHTAEKMRVYAVTTGVTGLERPATWTGLHAAASGL